MSLDEDIVMPSNEDIAEARQSLRYNLERTSYQEVMMPDTPSEEVVRRFRSRQGRAQVASHVVSYSNEDRVVEEKSIGELAVEHQVLSLDPVGSVIYNENLEVGYSSDELQSMLVNQQKMYREKSDKHRAMKEKDEEKLEELDLYNDPDVAGHIPPEDLENSHNSKSFVKDLVRSQDYHGAQVAALDLISDPYHVMTGGGHQNLSLDHPVNHTPGYPVANIIPTTLALDEWGMLDEFSGLRDYLQSEMQTRAEVYSQLPETFRGHQECPSASMYAMLESTEDQVPSGEKAVKSAEISQYALSTLNTLGEAFGLDKEYQSRAQELWDVKEQILQKI